MEKPNRRLIAAGVLALFFMYFHRVAGPDSYIKERTIKIQNADLNNDNRQDLVVFEKFYRLNPMIGPNMIPSESRTIFLQNSFGKYILLEDAVKNMRYESKNLTNQYIHSIDSVASNLK